MRLVTIFAAFFLCAFTWQYPAEVRRVVDGDTFDVVVEVSKTVSVKYRVRLLGVDTPEISRPDCSQERVKGEIAKTRVTGLLQEPFTIVTDGNQDSFGRLLAHVTLVDGQDLGTVLIDEGLAHPYTNRRSWCG